MLYIRDTLAFLTRFCRIFLLLTSFIVRSQCADNTSQHKVFVYRNPIYPQSRFQRPVCMVMHQFKKLFPTAIDTDDLAIFELTLSRSYQEYRKSAHCNEQEESAQSAIEKKAWDQAILRYTQEFCCADPYRQDEIIDALCDLIPNHPALSQEALKALYTLAGHDSKHAKAPLYQALINTPSDAHTYEATLQDTILLLLSLIRQGDSSVLDALAHHYHKLTWYRLAHTCYQLAYELGIPHADCALGNFYNQLIYDAYNNPHPSLDEYISPKHLQQERAECIRKMCAHYTQCWHRHRCLYAQERVIALLSNTMMVTTMELSDQEKKDILSKAAQEHNQEARHTLSRLYAHQGNYEKALEYGDESQEGLSTQAMIYEKLGNLDQAERHYLTIALTQQGPSCLSELIRFYQAHKKETWHYELLEAYYNQWHEYGMALLLEHKKPDAHPEHFLLQSLQKAETLKALEHLIHKKLCTHQQLIDAIETSAGDQAFKDAAYTLVSQNQLTP